MIRKLSTIIIAWGKQYYPVYQPNDRKTISYCYCMKNQYYPVYQPNDKKTINYCYCMGKIILPSLSA